MFAYQKNHRYFAQVPADIEVLAVKELESIGAEDIKPGFRGIYFSADFSTLCRINYQARMLTRVLAPLVSFECKDREDLYRAGRSIDWRRLFSPEDTFGIFSNVSENLQLKNSHFASLCLKDAVADFFRAKSGKRPNVDKTLPSVWINLFISKTQAIISLDTSGGSLHRRGYRKRTVAAPMQEILAAAIISLTGWTGEQPLYDPMCGSGTLLCEALMAYCRIPAGFLKPDFGFYHMPEYDELLWKRIKSEADSQIRELPAGLITGSDNSDEAIMAIRDNAPMLPEGDAIRISKKDFNQIVSLENRVIVCNPPYGIRMKPDTDLKVVYKEFGDFLKQRCKGSQAFVYFGNRDMIKAIGLKPAWKKPLRNAGLDGRIVKYEMY